MKIYFQVLYRSPLKNQTVNNQSDQSKLDALNSVTNLIDVNEVQSWGKERKKQTNCKCNNY